MILEPDNIYQILRLYEIFDLSYQSQHFIFYNIGVTNIAIHPKAAQR